MKSFTFLNESSKIKIKVLKLYTSTQQTDLLSQFILFNRILLTRLFSFENADTRHRTHTDLISFGRGGVTA